MTDTNHHCSPISRRTLLGAAAATAALGFKPATAATPKKGGTLRVAVGHGSSTDSLDPATFENDFTLALGFMLHNHLAEMTADGALMGEVAESWEASPDARIWTFHLRKGLTFHNGQPVTADDVIASIRHHMGEDTKSAAAALLAPVTELKAGDGDRVVVTLDGSNADFPFLIADYHIAILPAVDGKIDPTSDIGCGPYKLESFDPGVRVDVSRNKDYWKSDRAHFDAIEMLSVVDPTARTNALLSNEVDLIDRVDLKTAPLLDTKPEIYVDSVGGSQHYTFPMLTKFEPFGNVDVRMALKLSVDREEMVRKILNRYGSIGNDHPIGQSVPFYAEGLPQRTYDPDKAKWHLNKAGYSSLKVSLSAADAAFTGAVDAAVLYRESAAKAGIEIDVVREANDGYWSNVWTQKPWCACYWQGLPTVDGMLSLGYVPTAAWNDTGWDNPRFVELVGLGRAELDPANRAAIYYEAQELIANDGATVVPMYANYVSAASTRVAHGELAANWSLDGAKFSERWWFAG